MNDLLSRTFSRHNSANSYVDLKIDSMEYLEMEKKVTIDAQTNLALFFEQVGTIKNEIDKAKRVLYNL
eukprot:c47537_g1_i1 orf=2-202(-)